MRFQNRHMRKLLLCVLAVIMFWPMKVHGSAPSDSLVAAPQEPINTQAKAGLTLTFKPEAKPAPDVEFRIYRVAEVSEDCKYTLTPEFVDCGLDLSNPDAEVWRQAVSTLTGYIAAGAEAGITADAVGKTDEEGKVVFRDLSVGLYMVMGDTYHAECQYVIPTPFLVNLPGKDTANQWVYDVVSDCKYTVTPDAEPVNVEVLKVWKDDDYSGRPTEITVELYDGNSLHDTVVLSKENNWKHTWTGLYGGTIWSVKEKNVPEGYTATVEQQGNWLVITNTRPTPDPEPTPEPPSDDPEPGSPEPDDPNPNEDLSTNVPKPQLPQTGVLWWPVPVLLAAGVLLIVIGLLRRKSDK